MEDAADILCSKVLKTADAVCGEHVNSDFKCTHKTLYMAKVVMLPVCSASLLNT
jgi:hypothetical protein